jgi:hypothetical protein
VKFALGEELLIDDIADLLDLDSVEPRLAGDGEGSGLGLWLGLWL